MRRHRDGDSAAGFGEQWRTGWCHGRDGHPGVTHGRGRGHINAYCDAGRCDPDPSPTAEPELVTLAAVGDVMMARSIGRAVLSDGAEVVFEGVRDELARADITLANVESAISDLGSPADKGYTFRAPPETVGALVDAGVDVVALANNHALDYGPEALLDTRRRLEGAAIGVAGAGKDESEARTPL